jgi:phosphoribosylformylglycinamidine cyclo-ligase
MEERVQGELTLPQNYTYADAGVDRHQRVESKKALRNLQETYKHSHYGNVMRLPYGSIFPIGENTFLDLVIEGVGTKVLLAQLARKYDTIGIDAVAMAVNDVIRSGARPLAIADNIHAQASEPRLVREWLKGIIRGAAEAECPVTGGETGDVAEIIKGLTENAGFDIVVASVGRVKRQELITGKNVKPGDPIIGLASSGLHSNGVTMARKILFKQWGGKYEPNDIPDGLDREIVLETLVPTKIYVKSLLKLANEVKVKAAVHITGDAYMKFSNLTNFSPGIGFEFTNFKPQHIFGLIQKTAAELGYSISDDEMFKTFNMGWGFGVIVDRTETDKAIDLLERDGVKPERIGRVTDKQGVVIEYKSKRLVLT